MLKNVVAILEAEIHPFELGTVCEIFGIDRSEDGLPTFDFAVCASRTGPIGLTGGLTVSARHGLERAADADLVVIPAWRTRGEPAPDELIEMLYDSVDRGATVLSICSGAFLLAAAGLLKGRRATCHWHDAARFCRHYPDVDFDPDRLYVQDGQVITSAGTAAGIDACLHVVRRELGATVANGIARRMVVPPHRDGGQAQFVETPVPCAEGADDLAGLLEWVQRNLHRTHSVAEWAARMHVSPRTFARRFTAVTGTTPLQWLARQRVLLAQRLLEQDRLGIEEIARHSGFGTAELLRHHFGRQLGTTPTRYRRTFSHRLDPA